MNLINEIKNYRTIAIGGHIRPDGDCIGSTMALYQYIIKHKDMLGIECVDVFLEPISVNFNFIKGVDKINIIKGNNDFINKTYELFISLDCASLDRLGESIYLFNKANKTISIDHHISNTKFADVNYIIPEASSTGEVLYNLFNEDMIDKDIATALYISIIHDTGVLKHSNTSKNTMYTVGNLLEKGIEFSKLIDETFYQKTYVQNQILGRALLASELLFCGKCIVSSINKELIEIYDLTSSDLDGIIDHLRQTKGVEVAVFIYELANDEYKVSMRSNDVIDVSKIAVSFGGGGHKKAAGCTMLGTEFSVLDKILKSIKEQLN